MADRDKDLLREIAQQLDKWAVESQTGGWSTHQVDPQRKLALKIYAHLGKDSCPCHNCQCSEKGGY